MKRLLIALMLALILMMTLGTSVAYAADVGITKFDLKKDFTEIKIKAELSGFTVTQPEDYRVSIRIQNDGHGEQELLSVPITPSEDWVGQRMSFTDIDLNKDCTKLKIRMELSNFTITQLEDLYISMSFQNLVTGETGSVIVTGEGQGGGA